MMEKKKKMNRNRLIQLSLGQNPMSLILNGHDKDIKISFNSKDAKKGKMVCPDHKPLWIPPPGKTTHRKRACCFYNYPPNDILLTLPEDGKFLLPNDQPLVIQSCHLENFKAAFYPRTPVSDSPPPITDASSDTFDDNAKSIKQSCKKQLEVVKESEKILKEQDSRKKVLLKHFASLRRTMEGIYESLKEIEKNESEAGVKGGRDTTPIDASPNRHFPNVIDASPKSYVQPTVVNVPTEKMLKNLMKREQKLKKRKERDVYSDQNRKKMSTENAVIKLAENMRKSKQLLDDGTQEEETSNELQRKYIKGVEKLYEDQQRLLTEVAEALDVSSSVSSEEGGSENGFDDKRLNSETNYLCKLTKHINNDLEEFKEVGMAKYKLNSMPDVTHFLKNQNLAEQIAVVKYQLDKLKKDMELIQLKRSSESKSGKDNKGENIYVKPQKTAEKEKTKTPVDDRIVAEFDINFKEAIGNIVHKFSSVRKNVAGEDISETTRTEKTMKTPSTSKSEKAKHVSGSEGENLAPLSRAQTAMEKLQEEMKKLITSIPEGSEQENQIEPLLVEHYEKNVAIEPVRDTERKKDKSSEQDEAKRKRRGVEKVDREKTGVTQVGGSRKKPNASIDRDIVEASAPTGSSNIGVSALIDRSNIEASAPIDRNHIEVSVPIDRSNIDANAPDDTSNFEARLPISSSNIEASAPTRSSNIEDSEPIDSPRISDRLVSGYLTDLSQDYQQDIIGRTRKDDSSDRLISGNEEVQQIISDSDDNYLESDGHVQRLHDKIENKVAEQDNLNQSKLTRLKAADANLRTGTTASDTIPNRVVVDENVVQLTSKGSYGFEVGEVPKNLTSDNNQLLARREELNKSPQRKQNVIPLASKERDSKDMRENRILEKSGESRQHKSTYRPHFRPTLKSTQMSLTDNRRIPDENRDAKQRTSLTYPPQDLRPISPVQRLPRYSIPSTSRGRTFSRGTRVLPEQHSIHYGRITSTFPAENEERVLNRSRRTDNSKDRIVSEFLPDSAEEPIESEIRDHVSRISDTNDRLVSGSISPIPSGYEENRDSSSSRRVNHDASERPIQQVDTSQGSGHWYRPDSYRGSLDSNNGLDDRLTSGFISPSPSEENRDQFSSRRENHDAGEHAIQRASTSQGSGHWYRPDSYRGSLDSDNGLDDRLVSRFISPSPSEENRDPSSSSRVNHDAREHAVQQADTSQGSRHWYRPDSYYGSLDSNNGVEDRLVSGFISPSPSEENRDPSSRRVNHDAIQQADTSQGSGHWYRPDSYHGSLDSINEVEDVFEMGRDSHNAGEHAAMQADPGPSSARWYRLDSHYESNYNNQIEDSPELSKPAHVRQLFPHLRKQINLTTSERKKEPEMSKPAHVRQLFPDSRQQRNSTRSERNTEQTSDYPLLNGAQDLNRQRLRLQSTPANYDIQEEMLRRQNETYDKQKPRSKSIPLNYRNYQVTAPDKLRNRRTNARDSTEGVMAENVSSRLPYRHIPDRRNLISETNSQLYDTVKMPQITRNRGMQPNIRSKSTVTPPVSRRWNRDLINRRNTFDINNEKQKQRIRKLYNEIMS